jgi:4-aminobutyrate aminotransferase-like enzyme
VARKFLQWVVLQLLQLNIVEGKMQYLFDESGRRYLDAFAGIVTVSVGHCHPAVVDAVVKQTKLLQHTTTIYLHHAIAEYAEALANRMPGNLKVLLPATSIHVFVSHEILVAPCISREMNCPSCASGVSLLLAEWHNQS